MQRRNHIRGLPSTFDRCEDFQRRLLRSPETVTYGPAQVSKAAEYGAVEHLLLTQPPSTKLAALVERSGGHWETFAAGSPEHELLTQFTGMCAVLRFAVDDTEPLSHKFVAAPVSTVIELANTASVLCEEPDEPTASADLAVMLMRATEAAH